ncbi:VOC family protein [Streptomyces armeniacus]|uniref:VOC family protein n=1 Tax=Streptomyces armeniacus TaxID=83291 RepID=A0A345XQL2_9ACTN|nr:VOC family protein [Streptomyces armeniacus]AXK33928.1 VOC family protein [Streptomyces armeniacus]
MSPHKNPHLGGIVLGSTDPERLWEWYRTAFAPGAAKDGEMLGLELGGTYLIFESRDDVAAKAAEPGRILVNFEVADIRASEKHLDETLSVHWIRPVTDMDGEVFLATVEDPDGNYIQLYQEQEPKQDPSAGAGA